MKKRDYTYNYNNCTSKIRAVITDSFGNKIVLFGKHAFEWAIAREINGQIVTTTFSSREVAQKEFKKYR